MESTLPPLFDHMDNVDISSPNDDTDIFKSAIQNNDVLSSPKDPAIMEDVITTSDEREIDGKSIEISVDEPQKIGDGMNSYLAYKIVTKTNITKFKRRQSTVNRRFSDFLGLHEQLVERYLRAGFIIPPAPSKNILGATKVKMGSQQNAESGTNNGQEWVENRRASLERFLNRVAAHPTLRLDENFINFLESELELPRATNTAALSSAGVMRLFNKVGETVNKITYKMDENDLWFADKIAEIDTLDTQYQKLHIAVKSLVVHRQELAQLTGNVAKSAAMLSTCEEHVGLSKALSQLADIEEKIEILRSEQSNSDFYILSEMIKDYIGLLGAIKDVFHERVKVFQNWQHAQIQLTKKRENKAKIELSQRNDKLEPAQKEVEEWEAKVQRCQKEFEDISAEIKREVERFELNRAKDFKATIVKYLQDQMVFQKQILKYWEGYIPAAKEIA
ncbi:unnamed protein product [Chironomus riparius]|uniref:PX domain-containing protein n=1 Tax=Chironomus riparius TaxID=315576 RepID=A0A9N9RIK9_9DIPT|nr:unnamed protein product [Chironomus riparius]